jgi:two-component system, NtrC family, sensor kinase
VKRPANRASEPTGTFLKVESQVRQLRWLLVAVAAILTVMPTSIFLLSAGGVDPGAGGRVFAIHLAVAAVLILAIYAVPMRALQRTIAELKSAQEQLLHANRLGAIGEVYARLAHEINNPLAILQSRVRLVLDEQRATPLPEDVVRDLQTIERHGARIGELVKSFLAFARKQPADQKEVDLNRIVLDTMELVEKPFAKAGVHIVADLAPGLPHILGNPGQLQQVFLNLLNNARDALKDGGRILITTDSRPGLVFAEVQDNGVGIAEDLLDRIFDPFFTTKGVGEGTGLGLSVSYGIVSSLGGHIRVRSTPGKGSAFEVQLPLQSNSK